MTDYIKRIQSNLSRKNIKLSKPTIREELGILGYSNEALTDDLTTLVISTLVSKFGEEVETKLLPECEPLNVQTPQDSEINHQEPETKLETNLDTNAEAELTIVPEQELILDKCVAEELILENLPNTVHESESGIVVSEGEKHDLITTQSSVLDVQLSELETVELCSKIPDVFDDYKSFVDSVTSAIKTFVDDKFDHQETSTVDDSISELRQHIANRQARLDTKFAQGLNEVKGDLEQIRSNIKSRQSAILERFRIPAKT